MSISSSQHGSCEPGLGSNCREQEETESDNDYTVSPREPVQEISYPECCAQCQKWDWNMILKHMISL